MFLYVTSDINCKRVAHRSLPYPHRYFYLSLTELKNPIFKNLTIFTSSAIAVYSTAKNDRGKVAEPDGAEQPVGPAKEPPRARPGESAALGDRRGARQGSGGQKGARRDSGAFLFIFL